MLTQVTAYETLRDGVVNPDTDQAVRRDLLVHARPGRHQPDHRRRSLANLDKTYGGPPEAQLTALVRDRHAHAPRLPRGRRVAVVKLRSELGRVAEFPLVTPLPVVRGEILALTVPTWAPVLSFELNTTKFAVRQSRAQIKTTSRCLELRHDRRREPRPDRDRRAFELQLHLPGTRIEYSALEITTPAGFTGSIRKHRAAKHTAAKRKGATR